MKLIKLTDDHYVVVDDSEIKYKDWYLDDTNQIRMCVVLDTDYWKSRKEYKKITHSTNIDWNDVYYIPLQEVKELIGEADVEKNMWYERNVQNPYPSDSPSHTGFKKGFEFGYNQAIEDNKEKKYTEEDMRMAYFEGKSYVADTLPYFDNFEQFIQSIQPKTEWEVEFVDDKLKLK